MINIIIVDDHPLVRQGMKKVIEQDGELYVCCEAANAEKALMLINKFNPDLAVIDISLEGNTNGIELVKALKSRFESLPTLVLSMHDEIIYAEKAIKAGARGYVTKKEASSNVVSAIQTILEGEIYLSNKMSGQMVNKLLHPTDENGESNVNSLSDRESEVFELIGNGFGTGEIAKKLNLSVNTIESHRRNIKEKLGIKTGNELVKKAIQWVLKTTAPS